MTDCICFPVVNFDSSVINVALSSSARSIRLSPGWTCGTFYRWLILSLPPVSSAPVSLCFAFSIGTGKSPAFTRRKGQPQWVYPSAFASRP